MMKFRDVERSQIHILKIYFSCMQCIPLTSNYNLGSSSRTQYIIPSAKSTLVNLCSFDLKPWFNPWKSTIVFSVKKHTVKLSSAFIQYRMSVLGFWYKYILLHILALLDVEYTILCSIILLVQEVRLCSKIILKWIWQNLSLKRNFAMYKSLLRDNHLAYKVRDFKLIRKHFPCLTFFFAHLQVHQTRLLVCFLPFICIIL